MDGGLSEHIITSRRLQRRDFLRFEDSVDEAILACLFSGHKAVAAEVTGDLLDRFSGISGEQTVPQFLDAQQFLDRKSVV